MAQPLRIEDKDRIFLITTRTIASRLWFVRNPKLEQRILAYLARYQELYKVEIFAFVIMGNHYHLIARFPFCNKAAFMRALNAMIAKLTAWYVPSYHGGRLWGRRYSEQVLAEDVDVTHWYFYCVLNPVLSGLVHNPSEYRGYNSFTDSSKQIPRKFSVFERMEYNEAKRRGLKVVRKDFIRHHTLRFSKLPQYIELDNDSYAKQLNSELTGRLSEILAERKRETQPSKPFRQPEPGSFPHKTKKSERYSFRPLVLSLSRKAKQAFLDFYFSVLSAFSEASAQFRKGNFTVDFPPGTYRPQVLAT